MKLFQCQACGQPVYFENTRCENCRRLLGYLPPAATMTALETEDGVVTALASPQVPVRFCANAEQGACNWLVSVDDPSAYCVACRHNRMVPDLSQQRNVERWQHLEQAKRRLFYTLLRLQLPITQRPQDPEGLAFDFLADPSESGSGGPSILTGHDSGLITINIAEGDDVERERRRHSMGEPYRTLLGHFRHEVGHYYWDVLVRDDPSLERFRELFGDERRDYGEALKEHYANGPAADWQQHFVSSYASSHPWEDFAETWAHYLHIIDTLETAHAFGLGIRPRAGSSLAMATSIDFDPHEERDLNVILAAWLPLTFAVNSLNRSMGQPDLYPFVLPPSVTSKLAFIHDRVHAARTSTV